MDERNPPAQVGSNGGLGPAPERGYVSDEASKGEYAAQALPPLPGTNGPERAWRLLTKGELIQAGDEGLQDDCVTWLPIVGWEIDMAYNPAFLVPMRRLKA